MEISSFDNSSIIKTRDFDNLFFIHVHVCSNSLEPKYMLAVPRGLMQAKK